MRVLDSYHGSGDWLLASRVVAGVGSAGELHTFPSWGDGMTALEDMVAGVADTASRIGQMEVNVIAARSAGWEAEQRVQTPTARLRSITRQTQTQTMGLESVAKAWRAGSDSERRMERLQAGRAVVR